MKKLTLLSSFLFYFIYFLSAQSCIVNADSLQGEYKGDCKKGKANGHGEARGVDSYVGEFKNGYPDGEGKYVWRNGNWYEGTWKKGVFDGKGTLHKEHSPANDSMAALTGFWKEGKYVGRYEKPYLVNALTGNISNLSIRKVNGAGAELIITVKSITGGANTLTGPALAKPSLVDVQLIEGRFEQRINDENSSPLANKYIIRNISFPFYAVFTFQTIGDAKLPVDKVAVELYENSNYAVQVNIDN